MQDEEITTPSPEDTQNAQDPYVQEHPNAIQDPAKAEFMARVGSEGEENLVRLREEAMAKELTNRSAIAGHVNQFDDAESLVAAIKEQTPKVDVTEERAGDLYDDIQGTKR